MPRSLAPPFLAALLVATAAVPATAAEYCVSCSGPDASYRCEIGGNATDARAWLQCITELAKSGGHDSCSVDRNAPSPCPGIHKVLTPPEGAVPALPPVQMTTPESGPSPLPPVQQQAAPNPNVPNTPPASGVAPAEQAAADPNAPPPEGAPAEPAPKRVPQTMEELAGDAYQSSKDGLKNAGSSVTEGAKKAGTAVTDTAKAAGEGIGKAGSAVGNAAKKTWNCVTSLFQSC